MSEAVVLIEEQPELLDLSSLPVREDIAEMVRARSFLTEDRVKVFTHSGKIILKRLAGDEELATSICLSLRAGLSERLIAKRFMISRHTIAAIKHAMTDRGELAPVRVRVDRLLDEMVEVGLERVVEGIHSGEIHPGQLPIAVLAAYDKKAQRDAGLVVGTTRTTGEVTVSQLQAEIAVAKAMMLNQFGSAPDTESDAQATNANQSSMIDVVATVLDTGYPPSVDGLPTRQAATAAQGEASCEVSDHGGGGGRPPADAAKRQGDTPENCNP